jgi:hypothetical protein
VLRAERTGLRVDPLARAVFAALVVASFAAFAITQHLKHAPTVVQRFERSPYISPSAGGRHHVEHLSFRIADSDAVTVEILNSAGADVATLLSDRPLARYRQLSFVWDGHRGPTLAPPPAPGTPRDPLVPRDRGPLAPPGEYRVRVSLREQHRSVTSPWSFALR